MVRLKLYSHIMISLRLPFSIVDRIDFSSFLEVTIFIDKNVDILDFSEVSSHDFQKNGSYVVYKNSQKYIFTHVDFISQDEITRWISSAGKKVMYDFSFVDGNKSHCLLLRLGCALYSFDYFRSDRTTKEVPLILVTSIDSAIQDTLAKITALTLARDFVNLPPNAKSPKQYRAMIEALPWKNTSIQSYDDKALRDMGCGLITAVAAGGSDGAQAIILKSKDSQQIDQVFVGK